MTISHLIIRAPASTANLGPGFDCAAAALDLWNELHVEEGEHEVVVEGEGAAELPTGDGHLALRAFSLFADVERYRFRFVNRIPLERGLGSSAATIAGALVAGSRGRVSPGLLVGASAAFGAATVLALGAMILVFLRLDARARRRAYPGAS